MGTSEPSREHGNAALQPLQEPFVFSLVRPELPVIFRNVFSLLKNPDFPTGLQ